MSAEAVAGASAESRTVKSSSALIQSASPRQVARLAALQTELRVLGEAALGCEVKEVAQWRQGSALAAPHSFVRRRTARYRLPRPLKRKLLDRFCADADQGLSLPVTMMIVAHQDDESIGAGARLCQMSEAYVVHVTDGAPRRLDVARRHGFETREAYAEARAKEAAAALALMGVPPERQRCLGYVDGEASLQLVDLCLRIADLLDSVRPELVLTHPYEGGHTDHDATAFAVHLACGILRREGVRPPAVLEIASYNGREGKRVTQEFVPHERADLDQRLVVLGDSEQQLKERLFNCFPSQQDVLGTFSTAFEKFRPAPRYVFTQAPHDGLLNYERYGDPQLGERWRRTAEEALRVLRVRKG